jgi:beta-glucosidase
MATMNLEIANPTQGDLRQIELKQATIQVQPVTIDTPATTPEQNSPSEEAMTGKKVFSLERPMDKARELAAKLTLEEQVRFSSFVCLKSRYLGANVFGEFQHNCTPG